MALISFIVKSRLVSVIRHSWINPPYSQSFNKKLQKCLNLCKKVRNEPKITQNIVDWNKTCCLSLDGFINSLSVLSTPAQEAKANSSQRWFYRSAVIFLWTGGSETHKCSSQDELAAHWGQRSEKTELWETESWPIPNKLEVGVWCHTHTLMYM